MKPWAVQVQRFDWTEVRRFESYPEALAFFEACAVDLERDVVHLVLCDFRGCELLNAGEWWSGQQGHDLAEGFWRFDERAQAMRPALF